MKAINISVPAFALGLCGAVGLCAAAGLYAFLQTDETLTRLEDALASHAVIIEHVDAAAEDTAAAGDNPPMPPEESAPLNPEPLRPADTAPAPDTVAPSTPDPAPTTQPDPAPQGVTLGEALQDTVSNTAARLAPAPIESLHEDTLSGPLPKRQANGVSPFSAYKKPYVLNQAATAIGLAITDYGLSPALSEKILALMPSTVSLILSPYAQDAQTWLDKARADGHEVWLELPVQTEDYPYKDPGAQALLSDVSIAYNQDRLHWSMGRAAGYAGLAAYTDDALKNAGPMFSDILGEVFTRGLGFLELNSDGGTFVKEIALEKNAPYTRAHGHGKTFTPGSSALDTLTNTLSEQLHTLLIVEPSPKGLEDLSTWMDEMAAQGVMIAPVSAFADVPAPLPNQAAPAAPAVETAEQQPAHSGEGH